MSSVLLLLLSVAALGASLALVAASLGLARVADVLAVTSALCGLTGFGLTAVFTFRRARALGGPRQ